MANDKDPRHIFHAWVSDPKGVRQARIVLAVGTFIALTLVLSADVVPTRFLGIKLGQPSARTVIAPAAIEVTDTVATQEMRAVAAAAVARQYAYDPNALSRATEAADAFFIRASELAGDPNLTRSERITALSADAPHGMSKLALATAASLTPERLDALALEARQLISVLLLGKVTPSDMALVRGSYSGAVAGLHRPLAERKIIDQVGLAVLEPTYVEDKARRLELMAEASASVKPVLLTVHKNEVIVRQGEILGREQLLLMTRLGLTRSRIDVRGVFGAALMVLLGIAGTAAYLYQVDRDVYKDTRSLVILAGLTLAVGIVGKITIVVSPNVPATAIPVAAAPMLVTLLIGPQAGIVSALVSPLVLAGSTYFTADVVAAAMLPCLAAVYATAQVSARSTLYRAGLIVMVASGLSGAAVALFSGSPAREALIIGAFGFAGGLVATVLTVGSLPIFETAFKITTDLKLADLLSPNQPLMHELMVKAPGTYNHSTVVANLAEAAAEAIGGHALLARAGAYYHDIGKIKRPNFFVENQIGGAENPHDTTNPRLSSIVITAHVKEGVELAEEQRLPDEVVDIIKQHHGTSVVSYFYQRAVEQSGYQAVSEDDFRYEGDKPQTREAAIVMLADSAEAAVRALAKPTPQRIEQTAKKLIQQRMDDGQLDDSKLTISDLDTIARAFTSVLAGMYHARIEYPTPAAATRNDKRAALDGHSG